MFCLIYRKSQLQSLVTSWSVGHSRSRCHISVAFALLGQLHCTIQLSSSKNASFSVNIKFHQYNQACKVYSWDIAPIYRLLGWIGRSSLPYLITRPSDRLRKLSTSLFRPYVPLWDPWGLFFIYLTYGIGISNHKGMNLGWMNLGWIFIYLFLSIKRDDISRHVFHMFVRCEFTAKNVDSLPVLRWRCLHLFVITCCCFVVVTNICRTVKLDISI